MSYLRIPPPTRTRAEFLADELAAALTMFHRSPNKRTYRMVDHAERRLKRYVNEHPTLLVVPERITQ